MNAQEILHQMSFDSADIMAHDSVVEELTRTNLVDGTQSAAQYSEGLETKAYGMGVMGVSANNIIIANDKQIANRIASAYASQYGMDSDTYGFNLPSAGVPSWFTTVWTNEFVKQLIQTRPFYEMTHEFQQGMFGTTNIKIPTIAFTGEGEVYSDHSGRGSSGINVNWVDRETITLEQTCTYGDLSIARFGMAKIDYLARLREGMANKINLDINQIGFNGFSGKRVFGLLNDPGNNATITFPASAANPSSSQWIYKSAVEIVADINQLHTSIIALAGGNADPQMEDSILGVPPAVYTYLLKPSGSFMVESVISFINKTFPRMKIIQVQNYQGTGSPIGASVPNYCQLVYSRLDNQKVALNAFSSYYQSHGVIRELSSFNEKASYTVAGAIVAAPIGLATGTGL